MVAEVKATAYTCGAPLLTGARPFDIGERQTAILVGADRVPYGGIGDRGDIALALLRGLRLVDAARDVHGEHELEVHRQI